MSENVLSSKNSRILVTMKKKEPGEIGVAETEVNKQVETEKKQ